MKNIQKIVKLLHKPTQRFGKEIIKQQSQSKDGYDQLISPELPKQELVDEEQKGRVYVDDYTQTPTKLQPQESDSNEGLLKVGDKEVSWKLYTSTAVDMQDNALALQVMSEKSIDLKDSRIQVRSLKMGDRSLMQNDMNQINLGPVYVTSQNAVNIQDIDVYNIPDDKDIQLDREQKQLYAIGVEREQGEESLASDKIKLNDTLLEDVTLQEFKDKYLFKFEQKLLKLNKWEAFKSSIRWLPFYLVTFFFFETLLEVYQTKLEMYKLEKQELDQQAKYLYVKQKELLLNNKYYSKQFIMNN